MTFGRVVEVLEENGFAFERNGKGTHRIYKGTYSGKNWTVVLSFGRPNEDVKAPTLGSIIRQSGLGKATFRN